MKKWVGILLGLFVLFIFIHLIYVFMTRGDAVWTQMFSDNIKNKGGAGANSECPYDLNKSMWAIGKTFEDVASVSANRCLIPYDPPPDLRNFRIWLTNVPEGVVIGLAKDINTPANNCKYRPAPRGTVQQLDYVITGIHPCIMGTSSNDQYTEFKNAWFNEKIRAVNPTETYQISVRLVKDGKFLDFKNGEHNLERDIVLADTNLGGKLYLYKATIGQQTSLCFFEDESDEEDKIPGRIPLCSEGSGPVYGDKQTDYTCTDKGDNGLLYFYNTNEYLCKDKNKVYYCDGRDKQFHEVNSAEINKKTLASCEGDGIPPSKGGECCCLQDGRPGWEGRCLRTDFDAKEKATTDCAAFGKDWKAMSCPIDIAGRVRYSANGPSGQPPYQPPAGLTNALRDELKVPYDACFAQTHVGDTCSCPPIKTSFAQNGLLLKIEKNGEAANIMLLDPNKGSQHLLTLEHGLCTYDVDDQTEGTDSAAFVYDDRTGSLSSIYLFMVHDQKGAVIGQKAALVRRGQKMCLAKHRPTLPPSPYYFIESDNTIEDPQGKALLAGCS